MPWGGDAGCTSDICPMPRCCSSLGVTMSLQAAVAASCVVVGSANAVGGSVPGFQYSW